MDLRYLDKYREQVSRCVRCGGCQAHCPTYSYTGDESMVARGRMALVEAVIDGRLDISRGLERRIESCLDCKACVTSCPSKVKVDEIIYAAKAEIAEHFGCSPLDRMLPGDLLLKLAKHPLLLKTLGSLKRLFYNRLPIGPLLPASLKLNGRRRLLPDIGGRPLLRKKRSSPPESVEGRVAFYVGCATNLVHQHIGEAVIDVLHHNNKEVIIVADEVCCGIPFLSRGERKKARELAVKNIENFSSLNVEAVVTCCATCGSTLKDYPKWLEDKRAEKLSSMIMDIHTYLVHHTDYRKGMGRVERQVTWHDPCHLSRGQGVMDEPREILEAIPGLEFKEMKQPCHCCGFGGEVSFKDYKMSMAIASKKVGSIRNSGADELATGCPACKIHIEDALNHNDLKVPVRHAVEYLAESYRSVT